jgi:hypothetical protein
VSPELARGTRDVDTRSDIYSLGATLYHMLAGEPPFPGDHAAAIMACHIAEEPIPVRKHAPNVPRPVQKLIERMMEKNPDDRYQTPDALIRDIISIRKGKNPFAPSRSRTPETVSGRLSTSGIRRFAEDRGRRNSGPGRRNANAVPYLVAVVVAGILVGLLAIAVVPSAGRREPDMGSATQATNPPSPEEQERLAMARVNEAGPHIRKLLEERQFREAYKLALELTHTTPRTTQAAQLADELLVDTEYEARIAVGESLHRAEEALHGTPPDPDLALDHIRNLPPFSDDKIERRVDAIRVEALRLGGSTR